MSKIYSRRYLRESKDSKVEELSRLLDVPVQSIEGHKRALPIYNASYGDGSYPFDLGNFLFIDNEAYTNKSFFKVDTNTETYYAIDVDKADESTLDMLIATLKNDKWCFDEDFLLRAEDEFIEIAIERSGISRTVDKWMGISGNSEILDYDIFADDPTLGTVEISKELLNQIKSEMGLKESYRRPSRRRRTMRECSFRESSRRVPRKHLRESKRDEIINELESCIDSRGFIINTMWGNGTGTWFTRANAEWLMYEFPKNIKERIVKVTKNTTAHAYELVSYPEDEEDLLALLDAFNHILANECLDMDRASDLEIDAQNDAIINTFGHENFDLVLDYLDENFIDDTSFFDDMGDYYVVNKGFIPEVQDFLDLYK